MQPLKRVADTFSGAGFPIEEQGLAGEEVPFHKVASLSKASADGYIDHSPDSVSKATAANLKAPILRRGSIVIAKIGAALLLGRIRQLAQAATIDNNMLGIVPTGAVDRFVYYAMQTVQFDALVNPGAVPSLSDKNLRMWELPVPPVDEQAQIAGYLDRESAKIDQLIAKQEHLVGTLTERLESAWSERVDEIFEGYPRMGIRRVINSIVDGPFGSSLTSAHYSESGTRVIRLGNIGVFEFKSQDEAFIPDEYALELAAHSAMSGDVVVAGLGDDKMPLGRASVVPEGLGRAIVKADCYRVRPSRRVTAEYLAWMLSSPRLREQFRNLSRGSTRQRLNTTVVREAVIAVPSLEVQNHQIESFKAESAKLNELVSKAGEVAQILRERRAALISAAVTGKIDVRGL
jgi:type I restriction enzyme, S subunit